MPAPGTNPMLISGILWCDPAFRKPSRFHTKADIRIKVHQTNGVSRPIKVCHKSICPGLRLIVRCLKSITGPWREVPAFFCFVCAHVPPLSQVYASPGQSMSKGVCQCSVVMNSPKIRPSQNVHTSHVWFFLVGGQRLPKEVRKIRVRPVFEIGRFGYGFKFLLAPCCFPSLKTVFAQVLRFYSIIGVCRRLTICATFH